MSTFNKTIRLGVICRNNSSFDPVMFKEFFREVEIFVSAIQNNALGASMPANDFFVDESCHVLGVRSLDCPSFNPSAQIVPGKHDKPETIFCPWHVDNVNANLFPDCQAPCRMQWLFLTNPRPTLTFFTQFDIFDNVVIHSFPLISMAQLIIGSLLPTVSKFMDITKNFTPLLCFPNDSSGWVTFLAPLVQVAITNKKRAGFLA